MAAPARQRLTPKKRQRFCEALAHCGNVSEAARTVGVSRPTLYDYRKTDAIFAAEWDSAAELGADALEDEARRRAHDGVEEPLTCAKGLIYRPDGSEATVTKYSDTLLIFLLKGAKPEKYRDKSSVEVSGSLDVNTLASEADAKFRAFLATAAASSVLGQSDARTEG